MKILATVSCLFCLLMACRKNNNTLPFPTETQSGLNSFGCYIDGKAFVASTTVFGNVKPLTIYYTPNPTPYYKAGFLSIQGIDARYALDHAGNVTIQKLKVFGTGEYPLGHAFDCADPYSCDRGGYYNAKEGKTYFIETGSLTITKLDTISKIISGRFRFTAKDSSGNRRDVQGGVFDGRYSN